MGTHANITATQFPKQGDFLGKRANVCFHFDTTQVFPGKVIRDDAEAPFRTIIQLEDGRVVLDIECQYQPIS